MEKKKYVFVISSEITTDGDKSNIELTTTGNYSRVNGRWVLLYDEMSEDKTAVIKTMIKVDDKSVTITRNGEGSSKLIMTEGERNMCHYRTQFGDILLGVYCNEVNNELSDSGGKISMSYTLDVNASVLSENKVTIKIREV
ncbi:MAG: DUF1934 domain-containing protein [Clostridia bacterium]|nr:DUF1934 domain-containing protein [Clostridia bacterium]MBQ9846634.1 DUF1934 domain-containing protein [Clostridia bacterium]MBQ9958029.1 DUF1934 domain-containing protein [Clostridia bacterium]